MTSAYAYTHRPLRFAGAVRLRSFTKFPFLPYDIQANIIRMACHLGQAPSMPAAADTNRHPVVLLDINTAKSLTLVNKTFNAVVTRTLYENIHVTRPSTLRLLALSIYDRPELGRLVKSLHLGSANPLPRDRMPLQSGPSDADPFAHLRVSPSTADRFDYHLLFARSTLPWQVEGPDGELRRGGSSKWLRKGGSEVAFDSLPYRRHLRNVGDGSVREILTLARELLARTPLLRKLSLTGFLERAICGSSAPTDLASLQVLSLGPPPGRWGWAPALRPAESILAGLCSFRVCGYLLRKEQVAGLVGRTMPRLQSFQWSYAKQITGSGGESTSRLLAVISILVGHDLLGDEGSPRVASVADVLKKVRKAEDMESDLDDLFIEVRLHPRDVACILNAAPDVATRASWLEGAAPPASSSCRRRLKVAVIGVPYDPEGVAAHRAELGAMYEEGWHWFEESDRLDMGHSEG